MSSGTRPTVSPPCAGTASSDPMIVAIAGASGFVGRALTSHLLGGGHDVVALGRSMDALSTDALAIAVDVSDERAASEALAGVEVAYYLVHSMAAGSGFRQVDLRSGHRVRSSGGAGRRRPDHLSRRARGRSGFRPPGEPARGGGGPGRGRCGRSRAPGRGGAGLGQHLLRDAPLPDGAAAGHGLPPVGAHPNPAHRRRRPARLPRAVARGRPRYLRDRGCRRHDVPRTDLGVRPGPRVYAAARSSTSRGSRRISRRTGSISLRQSTAWSATR